MRTALTQAERLGRLVTELLDLSRIDAGALPLRRQVFEVAPLLAETIAEATVTAEVVGRGVRFGTVVDPPGATVFADPERLHQVVTNLLDNAARHSPAGAEVLVHARCADGNLMIEVHDEGPGIPAAERERVFERFTRGERASGRGTGLGLAIARWAVDLHGGTIAVVEPTTATTVTGRSHGGNPGCRIRVTLPATPG